MINIYRKAVYEACAATGINTFDYWVLGEQFPYIIISTVFDYEQDLKVNTRNDYTFVVDIFAKAEGKTATVNYSQAIKENLKSLDGVNIRISTQHFSDVEPNVIHTVLTLRFTKYK